MIKYLFIYLYSFLIVILENQKSLSLLIFEGFRFITKKLKKETKESLGELILKSLKKKSPV